MIEYLIAGLAVVVAAWVVRGNARLEKRVARLESAVSDINAANPVPLEETVSEMIDELRRAADDACERVTEKVEDIRRVQREMEDRMPAERCSAELRAMGQRSALPLALITRLAEEGLSAVDIARRTGIGPAEVELALQYRRRETPGSQFRALRRVGGVGTDVLRQDEEEIVA